MFSFLLSICLIVATSYADDELLIKDATVTDTTTVPISSSSNMGQTVAPVAAEKTFPTGSPSRFKNWRIFKDFYGEAIHSTRVDTTAAFGQLRGGLRSLDFKWETYAVARAAGDTRTGGVPFQTFNDNYLFAGVGVDRLGLLPGVRLIAQVGHSWDLKSQIAREGFDARLGGAAYYEIRFAQPKWVEEIYGDALYVHRYRDVLSTVQLRTIYNYFTGEAFSGYRYELGPLGILAAGTDTKALDYNRTAELRLGARLTLRGKVSAALWPQYVFGTRWGRPTTLPNYQDFRVLATVFYDF